MFSSSTGYGATVVVVGSLGTTSLFGIGSDMSQPLTRGDNIDTRDAATPTNNKISPNTHTPPSMA